MFLTSSIGLGLGTKMVLKGREVTLEDFWDEIFISLFSPLFTTDFAEGERAHIFITFFNPKIFSFTKKCISCFPNFQKLLWPQNNQKTRKRYVLWCCCRQPSQLLLFSKLKSYIAF